VCVQVLSCLGNWDYRINSNQRNIKMFRVVSNVQSCNWGGFRYFFFFLFV